MRNLIAPIRRRLQSLVGRCVLKAVDDGGNLQSLRVAILADELLDNVERVQEYGYTSVPHPGAEGIALAVGGQRDHTVVVATDDRRYRLKSLAVGEVALYDDLGNVVHLMRDRIKVEAVSHLEASAPTCHITAVTTHDGNITLNGNLVVDGQISATGDIADGTSSMQSMRDTYNSHTQPGDSGGTTGVPNQQM